MEIPLFPLSSIVMPEGLLPLRLFERRYIDMVKNCFRTETGFGVCLIKDGGEADEPSQPYPMGTLVTIVDFDQGSDGLLHIVARGDREFRLLTYTANDAGLLIGEVEFVPDRPAILMQPDFENLSNKLKLILQYVEPSFSYPETRLDDADWVCHRLLELLPLAPEAKFELLQMENNQERLDTLSALQIEIADR